MQDSEGTLESVGSRQQNGDDRGDASVDDHLDKSQHPGIRAPRKLRSVRNVKGANDGAEQGFEVAAIPTGPQAAAGNMNQQVEPEGGDQGRQRVRKLHSVAQKDRQQRSERNV